MKCLENLDKLDEAEELLRAMLQSLPNIFSPGHPFAAQTVGQLVQFLAKHHFRIMAICNLDHEQILFLKAVDETVLLLKADKLTE